VASLGATEVASLAGGLERMARCKDLSEANSALSKLDAEIARLNQELDSFRKAGKK